MIIMFFDRFNDKNKLTNNIKRNYLLAAEAVTKEALKEIKKGNINEAKRDLDTAIGYLNEIK